MKKIPTLFERIIENHKIVDILPNITKGCEEAFLYGDATKKLDGSCCAIINGVFYKRYDAKGKCIPVGAIPCQEEPDPVTGHMPCWVKVDANNKADKWFVQAYNNTPGEKNDGTYEAIGKHFQGNVYGLCDDILEQHGVKIVNVKRDFESIKQYLKDNYVEGLVFWYNGEPVCKIKRSDFGFVWGNSKR
jgi:hypothetical protein